MYFDPMLFGAVLFQVLIGAASRPAGAIVGFLSTTGVLVWGLDAYANGYAIAFGGIELSQGIFVIASLVWYAFDVKELAKAREPLPTAARAEA
jgi:hypothetical protein